ncbi:hypothetical protein LL998_20195 [Burkholderia ambifaria]|uniref:hypothetical protein n=1 Tax=Burkholderia ambifaria TaxID=152480 RepID=UPI001E4FFC24|nr:hypothetical protein [Burkholderia ambifaria]UEP38283.1 hypothetical protein LL998_20195 [Burkholderia ambifaria]
MMADHQYTIGMRDGRYVVLRDGVMTSGRFTLIQEARVEMDRLGVIDDDRRRAFGERMADLVMRNLAYTVDGVPEFDDWETAWAWFYEQPQDVRERIDRAAQELKAATISVKDSARK